MLPAPSKPRFGQIFRAQPEGMTGSATARGGIASGQLFLTPDRYSYFRITQPPGPQHVGRLLHTYRTYRELIPWAAVSRSADAPKARVGRPAPSHFRNGGRS
jgi:hypothetical protein